MKLCLRPKNSPCTVSYLAFKFGVFGDFMDSNSFASRRLSSIIRARFSSIFLRRSFSYWDNCSSSQSALAYMYMHKKQDSFLHLHTCICCTSLTIKGTSVLFEIFMQVLFSLSFAVGIGPCKLSAQIFLCTQKFWLSLQWACLTHCTHTELIYLTAKLTLSKLPFVKRSVCPANSR